MANEPGQALFDRFSVASGQFSFWTQTDTPEEVAADKEYVAARDEFRAFLEAQSAQITELQAEVERRGSETNAGYFAAQLEAMTRERDAYIRACDSYLEEIADLKRALDTARNDAMEEAANRLEAKAFAIEEEERDNRTWGGPDPRGRHAEETNLARARQFREFAREIRALQTKDQSHGA